MEVLDSRSALLSNYEVLKLLRELEDEQVARAKATFLVKKEQGSNEGILPEEEVAENLRTVAFEAIQYLTAEHQPMNLQTEMGIHRLTKALAKFELTKAEKLQIVNLAPKEPVELYVIIEELEDRLTDASSMEQIIALVKESLSPNPSAAALAAAAAATSTSTDIIDGLDESLFLTLPPQQPIAKKEDTDILGEDDDYGFDQYIDDGEMVADHEAGGFEGDLDMADDEE